MGNVPRRRNAQMSQNALKIKVEISDFDSYGDEDSIVYENVIFSAGKSVNEISTHLLKEYMNAAKELNSPVKFKFVKAFMNDIMIEDIDLKLEPGPEYIFVFSRHESKTTSGFKKIQDLLSSVQETVTNKINGESTSYESAVQNSNKNDKEFQKLGPLNGKLQAYVAKEYMRKSGLPDSILQEIWKIADVNQDGYLDAEEFALVNSLIKLKLKVYRNGA